MSDVSTAEAPAAKPKSRMLAICENIQGMTPKFQAALPAHIAPEKFVRTVLTTIQLNPDIASCDPTSIYNECIKAAADGLIIDGREAALVKYNVKRKIDGVEKWIDAAKYMPMVAGLLKKARNSGEISSIVARCVYQNDKFHVVYGDDEKLTHEPSLDNEPGTLRLAYMVARLKDGTIVRHVMTRKEIERRKAASRSGSNGPWKSWEDEMWVKTVLRAGMKFLPASSDRAGFDELVQRDDDMYSLDGAEQPPAEGQQAEEQPQRGRGRQGRRAAASNTILDKAQPDQPEQPAEEEQPQATDLVEYVDADGVVSMVTPDEKFRLLHEAALAVDRDYKEKKAAEAKAPQQTAAAPAATAAAATKPPVDDDLTIPAHLRRTPPAEPQGDRNPPPPNDDDVI